MPGRGFRLTFGLLALAVASSAGRKVTWTKAGPPLNFTHQPARPATNRRKAFPGRNGFSGSRAFYANTIPPALNQPPFSPLISKERRNDRPVSRPARHISEAKPSEPTPTDFGEDIPRPPAEIPNVKR